MKTSIKHDILLGFSLGATIALLIGAVIANKVVDDRDRAELDALWANITIERPYVCEDQTRYKTCMEL